VNPNPQVSGVMCLSSGLEGPFLLGGLNTSMGRCTAWYREWRLHSRIPGLFFFLLYLGLSFLTLGMIRTENIDMSLDEIRGIFSLTLV
jgi:hypothetical protein